jgi:hypothetical protein
MPFFYLNEWTIDLITLDRNTEGHSILGWKCILGVQHFQYFIDDEVRSEIIWMKVKERSLSPLLLIISNALSTLLFSWFPDLDLDLLGCCAWTLWLVAACVIMLGAQRYVLLVLGTKLLIYLVCICLYFPLQSNHLSIYHSCNPLGMLFYWCLVITIHLIFSGLRHIMFMGLQPCVIWCTCRRLWVWSSKVVWWRRSTSGIMPGNCNISNANLHLQICSRFL